MKRIKTTLMFLWVAVAMMAQVTVKLQAPAQVETGRRFNVRYVVNTTDVEDISVGDFEGIEVLYGPSTSSSSSYSIVNGHATQSATMTFTYTALATAEGRFQIPAATVLVNGKTYKSNTASIEVLPGTAASGSSAGGSAQGGHQQQQSQPQQVSRPRNPNAITREDLYIAVSASKRQVYEQEAVLLTYKLYTLVNLQQIAGEMPQLDGFHVAELPSKQQMEVSYERVNGRTYRTAVWRQYLVYPQKTGKLTIPALKFDAQVVTINQSMDPFDIFFGGGSMQQVSRHEVMTQPITIDVSALPTPKPASFCGAVGKFTISASLTPEDLKANDAATLRLVVSGQGNMKLMKSPTVDFPKDFEVYSPKVDGKTTLAAGGEKGNMVYDYVVVPRHGGDYEIAPVEFCYFDPASKSYQTLKTDAFKMHVEKAKGVTHTTGVEQEDLKVLATDIRYIQKVKDLTVDDTLTFFGSARYWIGYLVSLLLSLLIVAIFYRQAKENANVARMRSKKAGKAATRRLKTASRLLKSRQYGAFYDELMRALLGYAADKMNIPTAELNKDNVREKMQQAKVAETVIADYLRVLSETEFARFAPGDPNEMAEKLFADASEAINELER
ncbi:MAG: protein BatD [Bacteroidaceae bacterium]|nr:protein BatD [Bacteroidaceae bacterium]